MGKPSKIVQAGGLPSMNRSKVARAQQAIMIEYNAASRHNSETDPLLPMKDLKGTSPPCSVPPIVRRANMMLDAWPALHIVPREFATLLRDSIKRVTISGMMLSAVALANDVDGPNAIWNTHDIIALPVNHVPSDSLLSQYLERQLTPQEDDRSQSTCSSLWQRNTNQRGGYSRAQKLGRKVKECGQWREPKNRWWRLGGSCREASAHRQCGHDLHRYVSRNIR